MRKQMISALLCLAICVLTGCSQNATPDVFRQVTLKSVAYQDEIIRTFEEHLETATDVMVAEFVGYEYEDHYVDLNFKPVKVLKGQTQAAEIHVMETPDDASPVTTPDGVVYTAFIHNYVAGHKYLLVMERRVSVYYEYDRYCIKGDIFIPLDDDIGCYMYQQPLQLESAELGTQGAQAAESAMQTVSQVIETSAENTVAYYGQLPVDSNSLKEASEATEYIFRVRVDELYSEGLLYPTQMYWCTILESLKGALTEEELERWENRVVIKFRKGEVEPGEEYLLLLSRVTETSRMFIYSSTEASVHPIASEAEKAALYGELGY